MRLFSEWMIERIDEAKQRLGSSPAVRTDMDRWLKAVESLAKDLEELKKVKEKSKAKLAQIKKGEEKLADIKKKQEEEKAKKPEKKPVELKKPAEDKKAVQDAEVKTKEQAKPAKAAPKAPRPITKQQGKVNQNVKQDKTKDGEKPAKKTK